MSEADEIAKHVAEVRAKMLAGGFKRSPEDRKKAEAVGKLRGHDGRANRATGRTAMFQVRALPKLSVACRKAAKKRNLTLAAWAEEVLKAAIEKDGVKL